MVQIHCDVCGGSRKLRSGIDGDYRLWFTTIRLSQVFNKGKKFHGNSDIDICEECRDKMIARIHLDQCLIHAIRQAIQPNDLSETSWDVKTTVPIH